MKALMLNLALAVALGGTAYAEFLYFPTYSGSDGGMIEFSKTNFYVTYFDDKGDYSFTCKRLSSLTTAIHWGQCEGGEKFLFTLDPKHPETMKIGDVVYKECGSRGDKCH